MDELRREGQSVAAIYLIGESGAAKVKDETSAVALEKTAGYVRCSKSAYQAQLRAIRVKERKEIERAQAEERRIKRQRG